MASAVFQTDDIHSVSTERIDEMMIAYPYFSVLPFLKSIKLQEFDRDASQKNSEKAVLFFQNPIWFEFQLNRTTIDIPTSVKATEPPTIDLISEEAALPAAVEVVRAISEDTTPEPIAAAIAQEELSEPFLEIVMPQPIESAPGKDSDLLFEPLHMVDYFASQGIRVPSTLGGGDHLSIKLKSFTEWLKSMKKINPSAAEPTMVKREEQQIQAIAEESNIQQEVFTETLADVYLKQGLVSRAIEIFEKLSLLDPTKSSYFANRIKEINENI